MFMNTALYAFVSILTKTDTRGPDAKGLVSFVTDRRAPDHMYDKPASYWPKTVRA